MARRAAAVALVPLASLAAGCIPTLFRDGADYRRNGNDVVWTAPRSNQMVALYRACGGGPSGISDLGAICLGKELRSYVFNHWFAPDPAGRSWVGDNFLADADDWHGTNTRQAFADATLTGPDTCIVQRLRPYPGGPGATWGVVFPC